jgi:hypothetical protein
MDPAHHIDIASVNNCFDLGRGTDMVRSANGQPSVTVGQPLPFGNDNKRV